MKFDTKDGFFRAVYTKAKTTPFQITESAVVSRSLSEEGPRKITTGIVELMNAAFDVHEHCLTQVGPSDSLLEYRLNYAEENLPPGWRVVVMVEAGVTRVDLYGPDDTRHEIPGADKLSPSAIVFAAANEAIGRTQLPGIKP